MSAVKTMFDKIWDMHVVLQRHGGEALVYVDYNMLCEGPFYAFDGLRRERRPVRRPAQTLAFTDHYAPTKERSADLNNIADPEISGMISGLERNAKQFGIRHFGLTHPMQGIMHVVPAELGLVQPGMIITGADSHTSTHGAFGAVGFGFGALQVEHVLATQTIWLHKPKPMRIMIDGALGHGVCAKDIILNLIAKIGIGGGTGYAFEYAGSAIRRLTMEGRMTLCNMSIEAGARVGMVAPDETTFAHLHQRELAPKGARWDTAIQSWRTLSSDADAVFDREVRIDAASIEPMVTWGTRQDEGSPISGIIPDPQTFSDPVRRQRAQKALAYMGLLPGTRIKDISVDCVFIGSCTNARLEDLRAAADVVRGRRAKIPAIVVPGSMSVKRAAESEGLHEIFTGAGFEWRDAGCSMCTGSNGDMVPAGKRCVSTSNRNYEGRQGLGVRTHLASPAMAAAAAITGHLADVRDLI